MYRKTIDEVEERIRRGSLREEEKKRFLALCGELRKKLAPLAENHADRALALAKMTQESAALSGDVRSEGFRRSVESLRAEKNRLEVEYPELADTLNRICLMFSSLGV